MNFAFLIDPPESMKTEKDTSFHLMQAVASLGHRVYYFEQESIFLSDQKVFAAVHSVDNFNEWAINRQSNYKTTDLSKMDVIFVRTDSPFDRRYFYTTLLLDFLPESTKVVNRPQALRDWNEKLGSLFASEFAPATFVGSQVDSILEFCQRFEKIVSKPIDGHGGRGIEICKSSELSEKDVARWTKDFSHKIVVQEYVKQAEQGDKRILIFKGRPNGAILRVAEKPGQLNNLDQGGHAEAVELTDRDRQVCRALAGRFQLAGLDFVGIDMLGDYLTEVNVTSPTGLQELCRFHGKAYNELMIKEYLNDD